MLEGEESIDQLHTWQLNGIVLSLTRCKTVTKFQVNNVKDDDDD